MSSPANVDVFESHKGAETIPKADCQRLRPSSTDQQKLTILRQYGQALFHEERSIEDDQAEAQWEDIVAGANFEEITNSLLQGKGLD